MKKFRNIAIIAISALLVFAVGVGATLAYFTSLTGDVTNTFVSGNFGKVYIQEINDDGDTNVTGFSATKRNEENKYTVIPGKAINKNPQIKFDFTDTTPITGAYIYVKIEYEGGWTYTESSKTFSGTVNGRANALSVSVSSNWTQVAKGTGYVVFCYKNTAQTSDMSYTSVFNGNITVSADLIEADCQWINTANNNLDLKFSAYAVQSSDSFTSAADAWDNCGKNLNTQAS